MLAIMGRPVSEKTDTIRVYVRVAEMVADICDAEEGMSSPKLCSEILEKALAKRHMQALDTLRQRIEEKRKARDKRFDEDRRKAT